MSPTYAKRSFSDTSPRARRALSRHVASQAKKDHRMRTTHFLRIQISIDLQKFLKIHPNLEHGGHDPVSLPLSAARDLLQEKNQRLWRNDARFALWTTAGDEQKQCAKCEKGNLSASPQKSCCRLTFIR